MYQIDREGAKAAGYSDAQIDAYLNGLNQGYVSLEPEQAVRAAPPQGNPVAITQYYGQPSQYDVFSGGINTGVDYATAAGTPISLPDGNWTVENVFNGAKGGYIGDNTNSGYGNSVMVKNNDTGEKLRLSHLDTAFVQPNQQFRGGLVGLTGATGNVTGPHLDAEYYDQTGKMNDILKSPYGNIIPHR